VHLFENVSEQGPTDKTRCPCPELPITDRRIDTRRLRHSLESTASSEESKSFVSYNYPVYSLIIFEKWFLILRISGFCSLIYQLDIPNIQTPHFEFYSGHPRQCPA
jgi:hypothetical protein